MARFDGAAVFVTGAGSGIGRACAERLAAEGASVLCFDVDAAAATETARALGEDRTAAAQGDVRDREAISKGLAAAVARFDKVTHLVNAAGVTAHAGLFEITEEEWDRVLDVNLKGTFLVTQVVAPAIAQAGGGAVVNISSIESEVVFASSDRYQPNYGASKGGVTMLTKGLAYELAPLGIRVNAVAPGLVATPMVLEHLGLEEAEALIAPKTMLKRLAQPEEVAAAVAFLLSDDASYVTGVQLPVDGGWLAL